MSRRLEIATNVVLIAVGLIAGGVLLRNLLSQPKARPMPPPIVTGTPLAIPGVDWKNNGKTLVLAVSTNCHYCSESAPFYRQLANEVQRRHVHLTALLPQASEEGVEYLRGLDVPITDIRSAPLKSLKIRGTPTLLLVDNQGIIRRVWEGKLSGDVERQVIAAL